ncbi:MAG: oligosaccharide flippase family protein [Planctomycetota bacterium]
MLQLHELAARVVRGSFWVMGLRLSAHALGLLRLALLARWLAPRDFGLLGAALLVTTLLDTMTQTGFEPAVIRRRDTRGAVLHVMWTVSLCRGVILAAVLLAAAHASARWLDAPAAAPLIAAMALGFVLNGAVNPGVIAFRRDLDWRRQFLFELTALLADVGVQLTLAWLWRSAWALVLGQLTRTLAQLVGSYVLHPFRPRWCLDRAVVRELCAFGSWSTAAGIAVFLCGWLDGTVVLHQLGVAALGLYQLATRLGHFATTEVTYAINEVAYPTYALLQAERTRLQRAYVRALKTTLLAVCPVTILLGTLGRELVASFLGERWAAMATSLFVVAVASALRAVIGTSGYVCNAVGQPRWNAVLQGVRLVVLAACLWPFTARWGVIGAALATLASVLALVPLFPIVLRDTVGVRGHDLLAAARIPTASGLVMLLVLVGGRQMPCSWDVTTVSMLGAAALLAYGSAASLVAGPQARRRVMGLVAAGWSGRS